MATALEGTITFVHHEKQYVSIEYLHNGKKKSVNGSIREEDLLKSSTGKNSKPQHRFREGDEVSFHLVRSPRGDRMIADDIRFRYNNSLSALLHRATIENRFSGFLKLVDDNYFIKEMDSYHFFPLKLSPWEKRPAPATLNEPATFELVNFANPDKVYAVLSYRQFIPEYKKAEQLAKNRTVIEGTVTKTTPHGIYLDVIGKKVQAKLPLQKDGQPIEKPGDTVSIIITYIGPDKIAIQRAL